MGENKKYPEYFTNRDKKLNPRRKMFVCGGCDIGAEEPGRKCSCCGYKGSRRRLRK